jgi:hypothetical protein
VSEDVAIAQIVTAITTVFYAAVFAIGYNLIIRGNRKILREMRQERLSGGRPQIIVEMSLVNLPIIEFVVRNVSGGRQRHSLRVLGLHRGFFWLRAFRVALPQGGGALHVCCAAQWLKSSLTEFSEVRRAGWFSPDASLRPGSGSRIPASKGSHVKIVPHPPGRTGR